MILGGLPTEHPPREFHVMEQVRDRFRLVFASIDPVLMDTCSF